MGRKRDTGLVFQGEKIYSERIAALLPKLTSVTRGVLGEKKWWMRCEGEGCRQELNVWSYFNHGFTFCRSCRKAKRSVVICGVEIENKRVAQYAHLIKDIKHKPEGGYLFLIKCGSDGCTNYRWLPYCMFRARPCADCWAKKRRRTRPWGPHYNILIKRCERRGIPISITYEYFVKLCENQHCFYCQRGLERVMYGTTRPLKTRKKINQYKTYIKKNLSSYLDRIDPQKGYHPENVTMACWPCNKEKRELFSAKQWLVQQALRRDMPCAAKQIIDLTDEQVRLAAVGYANGMAHAVPEMTPLDEVAPIKGDKATVELAPDPASDVLPDAESSDGEPCVAVL